MRRSIPMALGLAIVGVSSLLLSAEPARNAAPKAAPKIPRELLEQRREAARKVYEEDLTRFRGAELVMDERLLWWSERWLNAELALSEKPADRTVAHEAHVKRLKELEKMFAHYAKTGQGRESDAQAATYFRADAEIRLLEAGGK
ncbi:MAG: hypothetical protein ACM3U2_10160 [Deltaproteobacteria bacterium]